MWLASCWGQAVNSVTELNVGVVDRGWFRNSEEAKEGEKLDLTRPRSRVSGLGSAA